MAVIEGLGQLSSIQKVGGSNPNPCRSVLGQNAEPPKRPLMDANFMYVMLFNTQYLRANVH